MSIQGNKCENYQVKVRITLIVVLLFALLTSLTINHKAEAESATLSIEPQSTKIWGTGESFTVNVKVTGITGLYGWQIKLYYNPNVLNGTGIIEGPFLKTQGESFFDFTCDDEYNSTHGLVTAFSTLVGEESAVNGTGVLLILTFKAKNIGNAILDLEETVLGDIDGNPMDNTVIDGVVQVVNLIHDVSVESLIAAPNKVVDGQTVDIHVIVANRGNTTESFDVTIYYNETVIEVRQVKDLAPKTTKALAFDWNTTGVVPNATCIIKAEASRVPLETILYNNVYEGGAVEVIQGIHDVAVTGVFCSSTSPYKGMKVNIYVMVENKGDYTETFNLTVYRNETSIEIRPVRLQYSVAEFITVAWDTADTEINATYLLKAAASLVPDEKNTENNVFADGFVTVYPPTDSKIEIVELTACDESGHAVNGFPVATTAYFKIIVQSTSLEAEEILLTVNVYDSSGTAIGVISFSGPIGSGTTTFRPGFPIPETASVGTATVYVNILTDWPHLGGVPYCPEESTTFEVFGS